ncbi:MAG: TIGR01906 family membrane protein [Lachnospiraceae bacterium]|nr:TIGR01906 family membrane protein [Lachnospiraceae bacterium]
MKKAAKVLYSVALSLFIICLAVTAVICFKPLYYRDIDHYDMVERTGMSEEEIRLNYDEMVDFLMRWEGDELTLPTLPMSEGGKIHFADVKHVFTGVKILGLASLAAAVLCFIILRKEDRSKSLKAAGIITLGIPTALGLFVAVAWDKFFVLFHKIFFHNDYWIFDARTDPVITILPDGFFMHCMILIVCLVAAGAVICFLAARARKKAAA